MSNEQFNLKVHERDSKGNIKRANHYRLEIKNGVKTFERPPGSGYFYAENGALIASPKPRSGEGNIGQTHAKPEFDQEALLAQLEALKAENAALKTQDEGEGANADELSEVHMTVNDVEVNDVPGGGGMIDLSEEIALMKEAGVDTSALEKKPLFSKPSFLK